MFSVICVGHSVLGGPMWSLVMIHWTLLYIDPLCILPWPWHWLVTFGGHNWIPVQITHAGRL